MNTIIISAFPGVGKTYLFEHQKEFGLSIIDSDSSTFSWITERRPDGNKYRNPDFPANYINHIKNSIGKFDIILVSSHEDVREAMHHADIDYCVVYPLDICKLEYIERYIERGNDFDFIKLLNKNWSKWIESIDMNESNKYALTIGEYLSDIIPHLIDTK